MTTIAKTSKKAPSQPEEHTVPLCGEATAYGEGCPIDKCRCKCHAWPKGPASA